MRNAGVSTVYVVNKKYEFLGILTADDASKAMKKQWPIADLLLNDIPTRLSRYITGRNVCKNGGDEISITRN